MVCLLWMIATVLGLPPPAQPRAAMTNQSVGGFPRPGELAVRSATVAFRHGLSYVQQVQIRPLTHIAIQTPDLLHNRFAVQISVRGKQTSPGLCVIRLVAVAFRRVKCSAWLGTQLSTLHCVWKRDLRLSEHVLPLHAHQMCSSSFSLASGEFARNSTLPQ